MSYKGVDYSLYQGACKVLATNNDYFPHFKSAGFYTLILEHCTYEHGLEYLKAIQEYFNIPEAECIHYSSLNDAIGNTLLFSYSPQLKCSPSSLRYIFHSHVILSYMKKSNLDNLRIVEVGGGYGGLLLAILIFAEKFGITIREYNIVDLKEANMIQQKFLSCYQVPAPYKLWDADTFGQDIVGDDLFFISNYCFSEIDPQLAKQYTEHLLPKCSHGFLVWNMRPFESFGKNVELEPEIPAIGNEDNLFVYF